MIGIPFNPDRCIFLANQALNANQFDPNVPDSGNITTHTLLFDTISKTLIWVDTKTNIIVQETAAGGSFINIPTPIVTLGQPQANFANCQSVYCHYLPMTDGGASFLSHSPKFYLFMAKTNHSRKKKQKVGPSIKVNRQAGFYHPTHQDGINFPAHTNFYGGTTPIPLDTEFDLAFN